MEFIKVSEIEDFRSPENLYEIFAGFDFVIYNFSISKTKVET